MHKKKLAPALLRSETPSKMLPKNGRQEAGLCVELKKIGVEGAVSPKAKPFSQRNKQREENGHLPRKKKPRLEKKGKQFSHKRDEGESGNAEVYAE